MVEGCNDLEFSYVVHKWILFCIWLVKVICQFRASEVFRYHLKISMAIHMKRRSLSQMHVLLYFVLKIVGNIMFLHKKNYLYSFIPLHHSREYGIQSDKEKCVYSLMFLFIQVVQHCKSIPNFTQPFYECSNASSNLGWRCVQAI